MPLGFFCVLLGALGVLLGVLELLLEPLAALREGLDDMLPPEDDEGDEGVALRLALEPVPAFWSRLQPASARAAAAARIIRAFMGTS